MNPIINYLKKKGELPEDKTDAKILRIKPARYVIYNEKLYRGGYSMPLLRCVKSLKRELHENIYENHIRRAIVSLQSIKIGLLLANNE